MNTVARIFTAALILTGTAQAADLKLHEKVRMTDYNDPIVHDQFSAIGQARRIPPGPN